MPNSRSAHFRNARDYRLELRVTFCALQPIPSKAGVPEGLLVAAWTRRRTARISGRDRRAFLKRDDVHC